MEQSCLGTGDVVHHVFSLVCSTPDCHHTAVVTVGHLHQQKAKSETGKGSLAPPVAPHSLAGVPAPVRKYLALGHAAFPSAQLAGWPSSGILKAAMISQRVLIRVLIQVLFTSKTKSEHFNDA